MYLKNLVRERSYIWWLCLLVWWSQNYFIKRFVYFICLFIISLYWLILQIYIENNIWLSDESETLWRLRVPGLYNWVLSQKSDRVAGKIYSPQMYNQERLHVCSWRKHHGTLRVLLQSAPNTVYHRYIHKLKKNNHFLQHCIL